MKISVIIPIYNKIKYIDTVLEQVRAQSFADFECLLIDDGSTDGSGAVCDQFVALDDRFHAFHIPNGGVSHARNVGLDHAKGEYMTFIDADDQIQNNYLENLWRCAVASGADLVISGIQKVDENGTVLQTILPCRQGICPMNALMEDFAQEQLDTGIYGYCVAKLFPQRLVSQIRFDETLALAEDFDFYLKLYAVIDSVYLDHSAYYRYLQNAQNSTSLIADEKIDYFAQLKIQLHHRNMLRQRDAYDLNNRMLLERRLSDYSFFVLFHASFPCYMQRFEQLYILYKEQGWSLAANGLLRKCLLLCLHYHWGLVAKTIMCLYRNLRGCKRGIKKLWK